MSQYQPQPPAAPHPYIAPTPPAGRPKWARKRVLIPAGLLIFFIGVVAGTDAPETEKATSARPAPTTTVTATATATETAAAPAATATVTASPAPVPTVTKTKTVRVTVAPADVSVEGDDFGGGGNSVSYANCTAVRAADADPIRSGDPGYGRHLDRDGDGVGCE
ncbi:excalibur calcium-binding domain-containing protein [Streptomyces sp. NPDC005963]|uniref:excalibur calcium-binding domain-containing protein n=1 Tax=Streptomyces sp. NPDC005963 TaxID=3156721 RepID=UPI0033D2A4FC